jgi:hypothetical protein
MVRLNEVQDIHGQMKRGTGTFMVR